MSLSPDGSDFGGVAGWLADAAAAAVAAAGG